MDWSLAIRRNRLALLAVVAAIFALLGGREAAAGLIARRLRSAALSLLRPAESAARRLIVVAARGLHVAVRPPPVFAFAAERGLARERAASEGAERGLRPPAFRLFDPPKRYALRFKAPPSRGAPRIRTFWGATPFILSSVEGPSPVLTPAAKPRFNLSPVEGRPDPDAPVDSARLRLRLAALERALADLPRQAKRLARWRARGRASRAAQARPWRPLRLGRPPGWRARAGREVDGVLRECHALALDALGPDTS